MLAWVCDHVHIFRLAITHYLMFTLGKSSEILWAEWGVQEVPLLPIIQTKWVVYGQNMTVLVKIFIAIIHHRFQPFFHRYWHMNSSLKKVEIEGSGSQELHSVYCLKVMRTPSPTGNTLKLTRLSIETFLINFLAATVSSSRQSS